LFDSQQVFYNSKFVSGTPTIETLSNPEWRSKIAMADPRGGASMNVLSVMAKVYGIESVKTLMSDPQPMITADPRQQLNWLTTGRYPIAFGIPAVTLVEYGEKGGSIDEYKKVAGLKMWAPGVGALQLLSKAPHPNATKVFVNWLLSRDVQGPLMAAVKLNSRRNDVPLGSPADAVDVDHIADYVGTQDEDVGAYANQVLDVLRQVQK
jgi:ABC-type thiamine transport system substrate-binding protein